MNIPNDDDENKPALKDAQAARDRAKVRARAQVPAMPDSEIEVAFKPIRVAYSQSVDPDRFRVAVLAFDALWPTVRLTPEEVAERVEANIPELATPKLKAALAAAKSADKLAEAATSTRLTLALNVARMGFRVFPCAANSKVPWPECAWKQEATTNEAVIRGWFADRPDMNYGVAMDAGHFILDLDCKGGKNGHDDLELLEIEHAPMPPTFTVKTPSEGEHLYLAGSAPNSVRKKALRGSIDVRGDGGYVVGPGSMIDGKLYEITGEHGIAAAPDWLLKLTAKAISDPAKRDPNVALDTPGEVGRMQTYLRNLVEHGDVAIEFCGGNDRTYQLFGRVMDHVSQDVAYDLVAELWNPNCSPPWSDDELRTICANAAVHRQNDIGAKALPPAGEAFKEALAKLPLEPKANDNTADDATGEAFELFEPHQFKDRPAPKWVVDGLVMEKRTHTLFGKSESMKTFQTLDLLASVAFGIPAFGKHEVFAPGDVVFFCDEDPDDLMKVRWPAWCKARGVKDPFANPTPGPGRFAVIPRCPLIANPYDIPGAIKCIRDRKLQPKVIAIDTWAKAMVGMNQDSATDTGLLFQAMGQLRREFGCATWLTHHPKKAEATEMRGSGAQTNDGDIVWLASRTADTLAVQWINMKMKSAPRPAPLHFAGTLHAVDGVFDQHGRQITAPVFDAVSTPANTDRADNSMTEKEAKDAAKRRYHARLRSAVLGKFQQNEMFTRHVSYTTKMVGEAVYASLEGPRPQDTAQAELWGDGSKKLIAYLDNHSRTEEEGPFKGLFKNCEHGERTLKKWFLQPSAQAEYDDFVAASEIDLPGDEPMIEGPDLSPDTLSAVQ